MTSYAASFPTILTKVDIDGDGKTDLVTSSNRDDLTILMNNGDGTFRTVPPPAGTTVPTLFASGDFTGDGKLDFVVVNFTVSGTNTALLPGNGDGTFQAPTSFSIGPVLNGYADLNGDGTVDLVTHDMKVEYNNGNGTFTPVQLTGGPAQGFNDGSVLFADFNGDGRPDIIGSDFPAGSTAIFLNGPGGFAPGQSLGVTPPFATGDFNNDGKMDYLTSIAAGSIMARLGNGDGTFHAGPTTSVTESPGSFFDGVVADVNGDGKLDLLSHSPNASTSQILLRLGNGDGSFGPSQTYSGNGTQPFDIATGDFNGDGLPDVAVANRGIPGTAAGNLTVLFNQEPVSFVSPALETSQFGAGPAGGGWTSQSLYPRELADVNGDGRADIVAFGEYGVSVALGQANSSFAGAQSDIRVFGHDPMAGGWTNNDIYPRMLADVNGDGQADIVGFGDAGAYVSLATGGGHFAGANLGVAQFGAGAGAGGWTSETLYTRVLGDVNGDGMADIVGFGAAGVYEALATGNGQFGSVNLIASVPGGFGSNDTAPRYLADVNGDGMADIVGFGDPGVFVSLAVGGGDFGAPVLASQQFGHDAAAGGWTSNSLYPRMVGDINGDGRADIVGFGEYGAYYALGRTDGTFGPMVASIRAFGHDPSYGGLTNDDIYPRFVADVDGDGKADLVGIGDSGVFVAHTIPGTSDFFI